MLAGCHILQAGISWNGEVDLQQAGVSTLLAVPSATLSPRLSKAYRFYTIWHKRSSFSFFPVGTILPELRVLGILLYLT